jgi:hypothetical protein
MNKLDNSFIVESDITFRNLVLSILKQIRKVFRVIFNTFKYLRVKDLRHTWGWHRLSRTITDSFKSASITAEVSIYGLVRAFDYKTGAVKMAKFLSDFVNCGMKDFREGMAVGKALTTDHPTLQASAIRFCLGVIIAFAEKDYTDARNEVPVAMARQIKRMVDDGVLKMGYMI